MLAHCKIVDVSVCASQAAARKAQPLWQQLGLQAKIYERKKKKHVQKTHRDNFHVRSSGASASQNGGLAGSRRLAGTL